MTTTLGSDLTDLAFERHHEIASVLQAFGAITREQHLSTRAIEKIAGISLAQLKALRIVKGEPEIRIGDLADRTATHQSSVSVVVKRLAEKGLVTMAPDRKDKRITRVTITDLGDEIVCEAPVTVDDRLEGALARMSSTHRRQLAALLRGLVVDAGYTLL